MTTAFPPISSPDPDQTIFLWRSDEFEEKSRARVGLLFLFCSEKWKWSWKLGPVSLRGCFVLRRLSRQSTACKIKKTHGMWDGAWIRKTKNEPDSIVAWAPLACFFYQKSKYKSQFMNKAVGNPPRSSAPFRTIGTRPSQFSWTENKPASSPVQFYDRIHHFWLWHLVYSLMSIVDLPIR